LPLLAIPIIQLRFLNIRDSPTTNITITPNFQGPLKIFLENF